MIPKIIHFCWLSGETYPEKIEQCLASWKKYLPDYDIWLWDTKRFDVSAMSWTRQSFEVGKYAFAADYIRLYAVYYYGGIYLDSDVIVYKSFDELLYLPYFIGQDYCGAFEPAVFGAEKGCFWLEPLLKYYENRNFIKEDGAYDAIPLPQIFYKELNERYKFYQLHSLVPSYKYNDSFYVFDGDFFNSRNSIEPHQTSKSYSSHCYVGSWVKKNNSLKTRFIKRIPKKLLQLFFFISHHTWNYKKIHRFEPKFEKID